MIVPIQEWYDVWLTEHEGTSLTYAQPHRPRLDQVHFVRDNLAQVFWQGVKYADIPRAPAPRGDCKDTVQVVGEHRSKSVRLPVFHMYRPDIDVRMIARYNFHDWNVSIESGKPVTGIDFEGYGGTAQHEDRERNPRGLSGGVYWSCLFWQGFPSHMCFGPNSDNPNRFSLAPSDDYELYAFTRQLMAIVR